jgi:hypothetical protein
MSWHIDSETLERYASGGTTSAVAASAEAHLTGCADCQARLVPAVDTGRLDAIWAGVEARVDRVSLPWLDRTLVRCGISEETARLLAATPSLTASWLAAIAAAVVFAVVAADSSAKGLAVFLTLAPMLPVAGVAAAYGREADPAYELAVASPYSLLRLLLVRSVAVVGTTIALTAVGGLLLADSGWRAAAWLLPALAMSAVTLALSARVAPVWAGGAVLTGWLAIVVTAWQGTGNRLAAFGDVGQVVALVVTGLALTVLVANRSDFAYDTRRSA